MKNFEPKQTDIIPQITFEGWAVAHHFYKFDWTRWKHLDAENQRDVLSLFSKYVEGFKSLNNETEGDSGVFSILGHKADLMVLHMRSDFESLKQAEKEFQKLEIFSYLEQSYSYVSFVELGLYEYTTKLDKELKEKGLTPGQDDYKSAWAQALVAQKERLHSRLYTAIPEDPYICFYPMNKLRGEKHNWYLETIQERSRMMFEHGMIGRTYAGRVMQIISGSIGFDDWEWGVDLFAKDPKVFKELIYEMRYDEASSKYAEFGPFYTGFRLHADQVEEHFLR